MGEVDPHAARNKVVFTAFCDAYPSLRIRIAGEPRYPSTAEQFPDVETTMNDETRIWWELGEWLDEGQTRMARRNERLEGQIRQALSKTSNETKHILYCLILTVGDVEQMKKSEWGQLRAEFTSLVEHVDAQEFWQDQSPQWFRHNNFDSYPVLGRYVIEINFCPRLVGGTERSWLPNVSWIQFEGNGGAYDPDIAIRALLRSIDRKTNKYGGLRKGGQDVRLIIYYDQGVLYNTPYDNALESVAQVAALRLADTAQPEFMHVYICDVHDRLAFEVYPIFQPCL